MAVERAEDKTAQMQARAGAVDELIASGALTDPISGGKDDITAELDRVPRTGDVELELAKMKAQLGGWRGGAGTDRGPADADKEEQQ